MGGIRLESDARSFAAPRPPRRRPADGRDQAEDGGREHRNSSGCDGPALRPSRPEREPTARIAPPINAKTESGVLPAFSISSISAVMICPRVARSMRASRRCTSSCPSRSASTPVRSSATPSRITSTSRSRNATPPCPHDHQGGPAERARDVRGPGRDRERRAAGGAPERQGLDRHRERVRRLRGARVYRPPPPAVRHTSRPTARNVRRAPAVGSSARGRRPCPHSWVGRAPEPAARRAGRAARHVVDARLAAPRRRAQALLTAPADDGARFHGCPIVPGSGRRALAGRRVERVATPALGGVAGALARALPRRVAWTLCHRALRERRRGARPRSRRASRWRARSGPASSCRRASRTRPTRWVGPSRTTSASRGSPTSATP